MNRPLTHILAFILFLSLLSMVFVGEYSANELSCLVRKVDTVAGTITVANAEAEEATYNVDQITTITIGGKEGRLVDLKVGQTIRLRFHGTKALSIEA
jgi:hypothetical protein